MGYVLLFFAIAGLLTNRSRVKTTKNTLLKWENTFIYLGLIVGFFVLHVIWKIIQNA